MMNLTELEAFRAVARTGGVIRAANSLHRAQSSVTARIKALEGKLGTQLFSRDGRALQLAPAGRVLLEYVDRILDLVNEATASVKLDQPTGVLRLGTVESTAAVRLPAPLSAFHEAYPRIALELYSRNPTELVQKVLTEELDAALIPDPVADRRLASALIYTEELVLVSEVKHPPIQSPKDVRASAVLAFHPGCPYRQRLEEWFGRSKTCLPRVVEVDSYHVILACVAIGMGVSLVPLSVVGTFAEHSHLAVHPLSHKLGHAHIKLMWHRAAPQAKVLALKAVLKGKRPAKSY